MELNFNFFSAVLLLGAVQGLFLALLLSHKRGNRKANRILALLMVFYSLFITNASLQSMQFHVVYPHIIAVLAGLPFLFGPLHYLYTRSLISVEFKLSKHHWLHFVPFLIERTQVFSFHFESAQYKLEFIQSFETVGKPLFIVITGWTIIIQGLTYMGITLKVLKKYSDKLKENFSTIEKINLNWLRIITWLSLTVWILVFFDNLFPLIGYEDYAFGAYPIALATSILIYTMGYLGLRQPEIFNQELPDPQLRNSELKYGKSGLSIEKATQYLQGLLSLMENEKPFLNSTITLSDLSEKLSVSSHNLSEVINTQLNQSFFDFINKYRVEEVKNALVDPKKSHYTLLSIGLDAGFNSKTSFNTIFKKHTNLTPSQYRQVIAVTN